MLIRRAEIFRLSVPLRNPFRIATMTTTAAEGALVCLEDQDGRRGWGEANPLHTINGETQSTCLATLAWMAERLIAMGEVEFGDAVETLRYLIPSQYAAHGAMDIALHDLAAQAAGMSVCQLLGGTHRRLDTDLTIGIVEPGRAQELAKEFTAEGHKHLKIKLGDTLESDTARVKSVRDTVGPSIGLRVDMNQGYDVATALKVLEAIAPYQIQFCEQPVRRWNFKGMQEVSARSPIPITADESVFDLHDAVALIEGKACHMLNLKLSKSGGIREAAKIASLATEHGMTCMMGGMVESRLGTTAACHVASAFDCFKYFDLDSHTGHATDPFEGGIHYDDGDVIIPDVPGLGIQPILGPEMTRYAEIQA